MPALLGVKHSPINHGFVCQTVLGDTELGLTILASCCFTQGRPYFRSHGKQYENAQILCPNGLNIQPRELLSHTTFKIDAKKEKWKYNYFHTCYILLQNIFHKAICILGRVFHSLNSTSILHIVIYGIWSYFLLPPPFLWLNVSHLWADHLTEQKNCIFN